MEYIVSFLEGIITFLSPHIPNFKYQNVLGEK